jgi:gliding motility-associated-like protein
LIGRFPKSLGLSLFYFLTVFPDVHAQFHVNGTATVTGDRCWTLTPDRGGSVGSIWNETKINLNESFEVSVKVFLGCKDATGADGMVFGFQPVSTSVGSVGEGIGFGGVNPSLGIEMDTWQNGNLSDPAYDHIALIKNGILNHSTANNLAGPFQLGNGNVEDCAFHNLYVKWNAVSHTLQVRWDCNLVITYTDDIVRTIFNNNPLVFWGFTAATGGSSNEQKMCLQYTTFLDKLPDTTICQGGQIQLHASGGTSYLWTPSAGLDNPTSANPIASPIQTTNYVVAIRDECGQAQLDTLTVRVGGNPVVFDLGNDTTFCKGQSLTLKPSVSGAQYTWQNGSTDTSFTVTKSGKYRVLVGKNFCYTADSISVRVKSPPNIQFDSLFYPCYDHKVILSAESEDAQYEWQDGSKLSNLVVLKSGYYGVSVTNSCGSDQRETNVSYRDCYPVFIPNVFSPNGDGNNDVFYINDGGEIDLILEFKVFDRWGDMVYSAENIKANDPTVGWKGERNAPTAVYAYYALILFKDGTTQVKNGDISLIR